eukprot:TRINITY_DN134_c1_g1_i1.p1 TRINITY_DN134_c1_g1~~TRINITY_DN134_c1_g1_i1.p1  ORF type:complete len:305 (-),score=166.49 TRINITY_DN134_c1_g1_i1:110-1024(-)
MNFRTALRFGEDERSRIEIELRRLHEEQLVSLEERYRIEIEKQRAELENLVAEKEMIYREEREEIFSMNLSPLNEELRRLELELTEARSLLADAEMKIGTHESAKANMENRLQELHRTLVEVQAYADNAQIEADKMRGPIYSERVALQREIKALFENEISQMRERIASLENELRAVTKQRNDYLAERNNLEQKLKVTEENSRREIYKLTGERDRAQSEEGRLRQRLAHIEAELSKFHTECELLREERERFSVQLKRYAVLINGALHGVGVDLWKEGSGSGSGSASSGSSSSSVTTTYTSSIKRS